MEDEEPVDPTTTADGAGLSVSFFISVFGWLTGKISYLIIYKGYIYDYISQTCLLRLSLRLSVFCEVEVVPRGNGTLKKWDWCCFSNVCWMNLVSRCFNLQKIPVENLDSSKA